ncbi:hypothetical protein ROZALSC1DRAFT_31529 [Rozella allomycis CSF55]|uniref:Uncharacterized protein n=1 Tax=Rozella allomycis (strain CSF55) TaxID=988480 RepID=A0A4V1IZ22_ROZAC|nr:hypothetical protein ROZALSC1DRAFT_31529 [Rozella allomycis CSF55]
MVGFRAPFLQLNVNTVDALKKNSFLYDSSVPADYEANNIWPYTLDNGYVQTKCDNEICKGFGKFPGLWNVPMWNIYSTSNARLTSMDYVDNDMYGSFMKTFNEKYNGNRSPMGIFLHPAWLIGSDDNVRALNKFIKEVTKKDDVFFVTNRQLIEYMKNPVTFDKVKESIKGEGECINGMRYPLQVTDGDVCDGADNNRNGIIDENGITQCVYSSCTIRTCLKECPADIPRYDNVFPSPKQGQCSIQKGLTLTANQLSPVGENPYQKAGKIYKEGTYSNNKRNEDDISDAGQIVASYNVNIDTSNAESKKPLAFLMVLGFLILFPLRQ